MYFGMGGVVHYFLFSRKREKVTENQISPSHVLGEKIAYNYKGKKLLTITRKEHCHARLTDKP